MKKVLLVALMILLATTAVFAKTEAKFSLGVQNTGLNVEVKKYEKMDAKTTVTFDVATETDIFFKDGLGINVILGAEENFKTFNLAFGFAYNYAINKNWSLVASLGPAFSFNENRNSFGMYAHIDFDFLAGKTFFARLGTGLDMEFVQFGGKAKRDATTNFVLNMPIPRVAIGWKF